MKPRISEVQRAVCAVFGIPKSDLVGQCRERKFARPRQIAMYLSRKMCGQGYIRLGLEFDRDHTTVICGHERITELLADGIVSQEQLDACRVLALHFARTRSERLAEALTQPLVMEAAE